MATTGQRANESAATQIAGVMGSCRCRTSKRSRSSTRLILGTVRGLSARFGSEPFAGTITDRPTGITSGGGLPCRPSRGWSARVKLPGRVVAHDRAHVEAEPPQGLCLELGVLHHRTPERPGVRDDDPDLHAASIEPGRRPSGAAGAGGCRSNRRPPYPPAPMESSAGKGERFSNSRARREARRRAARARPRSSGAAWGLLGRGRSKGNPHELPAVGHPARTPPQVGEKTGAEIRLVVLHAPDIGSNLERVVLADG